MYTKKEVNKVIRSLEPNSEIYNMLQDYYRIKFSWVEQIKKRFLLPDTGGMYTPHRCKLKPEIIEEFCK